MYLGLLLWNIYHLLAGLVLIIFTKNTTGDYRFFMVMLIIIYIFLNKSICQEPKTNYSKCLGHTLA